MSETLNTTANKTSTTQKPAGLEAYWKPIAAVGGILLVIGFVFGLISMNATSKEKTAQDELFKLESDYKKHVEALDPNPMAPAPKDTAKIDVEKLKSDLSAFAVKHKGLVASQMAALYLSDLLIRDKKNKEALDLLLSVKSSPKNLTSVLMIKKIGQLYADMGQCNEANSNWDQLLKTSSAKFAHNEIKVSQSLCLLNTGNLVEAEKILMTLKSEALRLEAISKDAKKMAKADEELQSEIRRSQGTKAEVEKILRLIQFKSKAGQKSSQNPANTNQSGS